MGFLYRVGQCPKCMRESFLFAAASASLWIVSLVAEAAYGYAFHSVSMACNLLAALSSAAVLLWLLHVGVYTFRVVYGAEGSLSSPSAAGSPEDRDSRPLIVAGRRRALQTLLKTFIGAAAATVLPSVALAFNECPGQLTCSFSSCAPSPNTYCCPKGYPILSLCNCRCYASVQGLPCNQTGSCFDENF
ncbi:MAG: hypothetical protein E5V94_04825 [Mesorhizobium sp.]|nr:MAG: hypothetical protein E5V94_04825 [Mesorhizobium sp.]